MRAGQARRLRQNRTDSLCYWKPLLPWILTTAYLLVLLDHPASVTGQHVVFEDIGRFAGATSYIHVTFHLHLDDLYQPILAFKRHLEDAKKRIEKVNTDDFAVGGYKPTYVLSGLIKNFQHAHLDILNRAESIAQGLETDFLRLKALFPTPGTDETLPEILKEKRQQDIDGAKSTRNRRFLGPIGAVLGTFLGIFSQVQIQSLERQIGDLYARTDNLIDIASKHSLQISEHTNLIADLALYLQQLTVQNPSLTLQDVYNMERNITRAFEIARNTFQAAQYRRLSIDFLRADHLAAVFQTIQQTANKAQATLIPERASDLFQLEMSYIFNGEQAIFILHVPTIPQGALLRLLRFHSFPLVYQDTAFLPKPDNDVIALSSDFGELSLELNYADLMDCQHNNKFYVCEKHGILKRRFDSTCLGALHHQNWQLAISLCSMEVGHHEEAVLHLTGSKYLVYSPVDVTAPIRCGNSTKTRSTQAYIGIGITEISVLPGCTAQLNDHQIIADSSIQVDTDIAHFAWNFTSLASAVTPAEIKKVLEATHNGLQFSKLTLADLMQNVREARLEQDYTNKTNNALVLVAIILASIALAYGLFATALGFTVRRNITITISSLRDKVLGPQHSGHQPADDNNIEMRNFDPEP